MRGDVISRWQGTAVEALGIRIATLGRSIAMNLGSVSRATETDGHLAIKRILSSHDRELETSKNLVVLVYGVGRNSVDRVDSLLHDYAKSFLTDNHLLVAEASLIWRE